MDKKQKGQQDGGVEELRQPPRDRNEKLKAERIQDGLTVLLGLMDVLPGGRGITRSRVLRGARTSAELTYSTLYAEQTGADGDLAIASEVYRVDLRESEMDPGAEVKTAA